MRILAVHTGKELIMSYIDSERYDDFMKVRDRVGGELGERLTEKIAELYAVYDRRMIKWLAELYDPEIGGFYYSVPARDTEGFLPDIESTYGVLAAFHSMGMIRKYGENFADAVPSWLNRRVGEFIKGLQDPDGYFYMPQWGKGVSLLRRSRDLTSAKYLLDCIGVEPKYPLPIPSAKSDDSYDLSNAPEHFRSVEAFKAYLYSCDLSKTSYHTGSELLSQTAEIKAYGQMLGTDLLEVVITWLNEFKRADNGLWQEEINYHAINGLHKLSWVYNLAGAPLPDADKCIESALKVIMSDVPGTVVVDIYNPWHAVGECVKNVKKFFPDEYERIVTKLREGAIPAIDKTIEKIKPFKQPDGTVSYSIGGADFTSQGSLASPRDKRGASVNGAMCGSVSLTSSVFKALDLDDLRVPLFTESDFDYFVETITRVNDEYLAKKGIKQ